VVDGRGLLDLPNDLQRVIVEGLLGSNEGGAELVVRAWLRLRLTCRDLCKLIADVPLDLRFPAPLTDAQVCPAVSPFRRLFGLPLSGKHPGKRSNNVCLIELPGPYNKVNNKVISYFKSLHKQILCVDRLCFSEAPLERAVGTPDRMLLRLSVVPETFAALKQSPMGSRTSDFEPRPLEVHGLCEPQLAFPAFC
jgi:hypothetical protein